jgi:GxxExxY protein
MTPLSEPKDALSEKIIGLAMKVHRTLGPGFVEFVYRNALIHELKANHIGIETEKRLKVFYEDVIVGEFKADLFLDGWLMCELKAVQKLLPEHQVQLVNYLSILKLDFGLLLNFGGWSLEFQRKYRKPQPAHKKAEIGVSL